MTALPEPQSILLQQMGVVDVPTPNDHQRHNQYTCGNWGTERESCATFDELVEHTGAFKIYKEVQGRYTSLRPSQDLATPRIDRVLRPSDDLIEQGWELGPVGVECKRSDAKLGPAISQCLDYSRAVWRIRGLWVSLDWVFIWPAGKTSGTVASILAQQRIGTIHSGSHYSLHFGTGEERLAMFDNAGNLTDVKPGRSGRRTGSR
jgi:hypothetical protein